MNKKYNYLQIISNFDTRQYRAYETIIDNLDIFCESVYSSIIKNKPNCHKVFFDTKNDFLNYLKEDTEGLGVSRIESSIISFIYRNKSFSDFYQTRPICYSNVSSSIICGWTNKTKTLSKNLNQLEMIYQNYIKFIHTQPGIDFLDKEIAVEDKPFYDQGEEVFNKLNQCKKKVIRKTGNSVVSNLICNILWDEMFLSQGKINFKKCEESIWKVFPKDKLPHTTLFTRLKTTYVNMLSNLLQDNLIEDYFDTSKIFTIEGKNYTIRTAIEDWLKQAKIDLFFEKKTTTYSRINQTSIINAVEKFCRDYGFLYKENTSNPDVLVACKCDLYYSRHKSAKLYFYKNGVVKDFYNNITTSVKNALPKGYI